MAEGTLSGVVVGGIIGFASSIGVSILTETCKQRREAKTLARAFKGGVAAILSIIEERQYATIIDQHIALANSGGDFDLPTARAKRNYVELYNKNVDRIGLLHEALAEKIPKFYTYVNSLIEDLDLILEKGTTHMSRDEKLRALKEFKAILDKTTNLGNEIISLVDKKYRDRCWLQLW